MTTRRVRRRAWRVVAEAMGIEHVELEQDTGATEERRRAESGRTAVGERASPDAVGQARREKRGIGRDGAR